MLYLNNYQPEKAFEILSQAYWKASTAADKLEYAEQIITTVRITKPKLEAFFELLLNFYGIQTNLKPRTSVKILTFTKSIVQIGRAHV